jgi:hypothetical protein
VVDDDPQNAALQRLRFWVDTDNDGDWSDETTLITSTAVDDDWPLTQRAPRSGAHRKATPGFSPLTRRGGRSAQPQCRLSLEMPPPVITSKPARLMGGIPHFFSSVQAAAWAGG